MELAASGVVVARWTADIHNEWIEALMRQQPSRSRAALERTRNLMDAATHESVVEGYAYLIPDLQLPDDNDRHVLAAAIVGGCRTIVTQNIKDFPKEILTPYGITAETPDRMLCEILVERPASFVRAVTRVRERLKNPPMTQAQHLQVLERQNLPMTLALLKEIAEM